MLSFWWLCDVINWERLNERLESIKKLEDQRSNTNETVIMDGEVQADGLWLNIISRNLFDSWLRESLKWEINSVSNANNRLRALF